MHFFGLLKMILGALKIAVESFEIIQCLLFSNVYEIFCYLPYLILFDRQTDQLTKEGKTEAPNRSLKSLCGKGFQ